MWNFPSLAFALLLIAVVAQGATSANGLREPSCDKYQLPACSRNYEPVCGSDEITYSNECMLCFENSFRTVKTLLKKTGEC